MIDTPTPPPGDPLESSDVLVGRPDDRKLTESLFAFIWLPVHKTPKGWLALFMVALSMAGLLLIGLTYTVAVGIGVWGNNIPVAWAFDIVNFVWWIGIGHAGTLISAILLLFQQKWRTSINRFSEAMTLFAVMCAGIFPALHTGRPWFDFFLFPYPSTTQLWPNFKSPLMWDVFAVSTYFTTSLLFWYLGLIPDLATLRDSSPNPIARKVYGIFSLGWRGGAKQWQHWMAAYGILAGISTPLVLSVHTIVSFDFAVSNLPGWHTTIFPPYFVAGAVFSGFAMVLTLIIPARHYLGLKHVVTERHIENMTKVILVTGWIVTYGYAMENFIAWYSGDHFEAFGFANRRFGPFGPLFWLLVFCNCVAPQFFWSKKARTNLWLVWVLSIVINIGMWLERFIIVAVSLHRDFMPSSWSNYRPTWVDICIYVGTIGLFSTLFLLFLRFVPAIAASEVKELRHELEHEEHLRAAALGGTAGTTGGGH